MNPSQQPWNKRKERREKEERKKRERRKKEERKEKERRESNQEWGMEMSEWEDMKKRG